jgi:Flp pilus assembly protein TadG
VLHTSFRSFLRDESGSYTIWSLIWFSLYVAIGGLAVDMTDAYRNQTLLQSTADASALAG